MMWLLSIKTDGTKKARLVGRGDMTIPLVDFDPDAVYCGNVSLWSERGWRKSGISKKGSLRVTTGEAVYGINN